MSIESRINKLFRKVSGDRIPIHLENNETLYLDQNDVLDLVCLAIEKSAVIKENGATICKPIPEDDLPEKAKKLRRCSPGEMDKLPKLVGGLLYED